MKYITQNFLQLIILVVVAVLLIDRCGGKTEKLEPSITVKRDTVWSMHDSTVFVKPTIIRSEATPQDQWDTLYRPSANNDTLLKQYISAVNELLTKNYYPDSLKIDSIGYVYVNDTINKNKITGRSYRYNLKHPTITNTVTIREPYKPKSQLYIGGQLSGSPENLVQQINAGLLLKNKRDQIYGITAGMDMNGHVIYGLQSYWKISFRKK
jgi:hypothetical protein